MSTAFQPGAFQPDSFQQFGGETSSAPINQALTGLSATTSYGTLGAQAGSSVTIALTGQSVTASKGVLSAVTDQTQALTGQSVTASQGAFARTLVVGVSTVGSITPALTTYTSAAVDSPYLLEQWQNRFVYQNGKYRGYGELRGFNTRYAERVFEYAVNPAVQSYGGGFNIWDDEGSYRNMVPSYNGNPYQSYGSGSGKQYSDARQWGLGGQISVAPDDTIVAMYTRVYDIGYTYPDVRVSYSIQFASTGLLSYYGPEIERDNITQRTPITAEGGMESAMGVVALDANHAIVFYPSYWDNSGTTNYVPTYQKVSQFSNNEGTLDGSAVQLTSFSGVSVVRVIPKSFCVTRSGYGDIAYITYLSGTTGSPYTPAYVGLIVLDLVTLSITSHTLTATATSPSTYWTLYGYQDYASAFIPTQSVSQVAKLGSGTSVTQYLLGSRTPQVVHLSWTSSTFTSPTLTLKNGPSSDTGNGYYLVPGWESLEIRGGVVHHVVAVMKKTSLTHYHRLVTNDATGTGATWDTDASDRWTWSTSSSATYNIFNSASARDVDTWFFFNAFHLITGDASTDTTSTAWLDYFSGNTLLSVEAEGRVGRVTLTINNGIEQSLAGQGITVLRGAFGFEQALTGRSVTTAYGTLTPVVGGADINQPLTGQSVTVGRGTLTPTISYTVALTGQSTTVSRGDLGVGHGLTGQQVTASRGALGVGHGLTGQSVTLSQGTATPGISVTLTGQQLATARDTLAASSGRTLTGQQVAASQGTFGVGISVALTGQSVAAAQGTLTPGTTKALTGQQVAVSRGSFQVFMDLVLSGRQLTVTRGDFGFRIDTPIYVTGVYATGEVGTVTAGDVPIPSNAYLWTVKQDDLLFVVEKPVEQARVEEPVDIFAMLTTQELFQKADDDELYADATLVD